MTSRQLSLDQLAPLSPETRLEYLIHAPEDQWLERKSVRVAARQLGDLLVGFANAEGGLIVIGVHDGRVEGLRQAGNRVNEWRQAALNFTEPPVRHKLRELESTTEAGEEDAIVVIEVESADRVHATTRGQSFLRVGDENRKLGPLELSELRFDKGASSFDGEPVSGASLDDLDEALVTLYGDRLRASAGGEQALSARGLARRTATGVTPTVAGLLVLGREPYGRFPEGYVRLIRYHGSSRETGTRLNVIADVRAEGSLPAQIDAARGLLNEWLPSATRLGREGLFVSSTLIPELVWLEAIVNAVSHRSYSFSGDHTRVELFDDRLEVQSPGRLPGLVRVESIRSTRFARNPRIARALADLGYGRELGEGVMRMFEEMKRAGLPDPVYAEDPASVRVTLLADPLGRRILDHLPRGSERFVEHLSRTGRVTTTEAVELLGRSRPTVLKHLHNLANRGLVDHTGTSIKDPRGDWRLARGGPASS